MRQVLEVPGNKIKIVLVQKIHYVKYLDDTRQIDLLIRFIIPYFVAVVVRKARIKFHCLQLPAVAPSYDMREFPILAYSVPTIPAYGVISPIPCLELGNLAVYLGLG